MMNLKYTASLLLIILTNTLLYSQNKMYQYGYDNAGNRISRDMVPLRIEDPGGSNPNDQLVKEERAVNGGNAMDSRSLAVDEMEISFYPNPASKVVHVEYSQPEVSTSEVRILANNGKVVYQRQNILGSFELPFENLAPGTYFIWLKINDTIRRQKVIKE